MRIRKTAFRAALAALLGAALFMACESDSGGTPESGTPESGTTSAEINNVTSEPSSSAITLNFTADISGSKGDTVSVSFSVSGASNYKQVAAASETFGLDWIQDSQIWSDSGVSDGSTSKFTVTATADFTNIAFKIYVQHPLDSSKSSAVTISDIRVTVTSASGGSGGSGSGSGEVTFPNDDNYEADTTGLPDFASSCSLGWNLGNALDAHDNGTASETAWGNPEITSKIFEGVKSAGFDTVRVPVTWLGHIGSAPDYTIDSDYLSRVAEVVGYAKDAGLKVIINIHHDGADSAHWLDIKSACGYVSKTESNPTDASATAANTAIKEQLWYMWSQIAAKFPDSADYLIFETMNEIHDGGWGWGENRQNSATKQYDILNEWNQVCVRAIRYTGAKNYISVPGYCTNPDLTMAYFKLPTDKLSRLILTVHYYDPTNFVLNAQYDTWDAAVSAENYGSQTEMKQKFTKLKSFADGLGVPCFISECGAVYMGDSSASSERQKYNLAVITEAKAAGLLPVFWDNGSSGTGAECSGLFNRSTGAVYDHCSMLVSAMAAAAQ